MAPSPGRQPPCQNQPAVHLSQQHAQDISHGACQIHTFSTWPIIYATVNGQRPYASAIHAHQHCRYKLEYRPNKPEQIHQCSPTLQNSSDVRTY